jgi:hypothetical protein
MTQHLPLANFVVLLLTLVALCIYTFYTKRIAKSATDQVEGMSRPCLTIFARLRDPVDVVSQVQGPAGGTVARGDDGNFVVQNIGTGVALNVTYHFENLDSPAPSRREKTYFLNVPRCEGIRMPVPMNASRYSGNCKVFFQFESIGGRHYQSTVTMNSHVLTAFKIETMKA